MDQSSVFISYRRLDGEFVRYLDAELRANGRKVWVDWADIPPGSLDFQEEIKSGIDQADALIAVLSPDYLDSEYCLMELEYAHRSGKRLVPIIYRDIHQQNIPHSISHINWVYFNQSDSFETAIEKTEQALDTDYGHVTTHTRLLLRAREWEAAAHDRSLLLRGNELRRAESWIRHTKDKRPSPIELHNIFIRTSRNATNGRRLRTLAASIVVALILVLAVFAFYQRYQAIQSERIARSLVLGSSSLVVLDDNNTDLAIALALGARELGGETEIANERALAIVAYAPGTRRVLSGHSDTVRSVQFIPNSHHVISGSQDDSVIVWDYMTGEIIYTLTGHTGDVRSVAVNAEGTQAVSGSSDNNLIVWDLATGEIIQTLRGHTRRIRGVDFSPDGKMIISAAEDGNVNVWSSVSGNLILTLPQPTDAGFALSVAYSPDGATALVGYSSGLVVWWNILSQAPVKSFQQHTGWVESVVFTPDGQHALTGSRDLEVHYWDLINETYIPLLGHTDWVLHTDISQNGQYALTSSEDETIRIWDLNLGIEIQRFEGHTNGVWQATFSLEDLPDNSKPQHIISGASDGDVRLWDVNSQDQASRLNADAHSQIIALAVVDDGLTFGTSGGRLQHWKTSAESPESLSGGHLFSSINTVISSEDGDIIISGASDNTLVVWNETDIAQRFEGHDSPITAAAFTNDEQWILSGDESGTLILWDINTAEIIRTFNEDGENHSNRINGIAIDGNRAATAADGNTILLWDINTGNNIGRLEGHTESVNDLVFDDDGIYLYSVSDDESIIMWDMETSSIFRRFLGHTESVFSIDYFNTDDNRTYLISGAGDLTVRVWDVQTGQELRRFEGHTSRVTQVFFTSNGEQAVSAGLDGTIRFWRIHNSADLVVWTEANRYVRALAPEECAIYQANELCES